MYEKLLALGHFSAIQFLLFPSFRNSTDECFDSLLAVRFQQIGVGLAYINRLAKNVNPICTVVAEAHFSFHSLGVLNCAVGEILLVFDDYTELRYLLYRKVV